MKVVSVALAVIGALGVLPRAVTGQQPVFTTTTAAVRLEIIVSARGRPVLGLQRADFTVTHDGVPVAGLEVSEFKDIPLQLSVVRSLRVDRVVDVPALFGDLRADLRQHDVVRLFADTDGPAQMSDIGTRRAALVARSSAVLDTVALASTMFGEQPGRRVVLAVGDGTDRGSLLTTDQVAALAVSRNVTVLFVGYNVVGSVLFRRPQASTSEGVFEQENRFPTQLVRRLVEKTGGEAIHTNSGGDRGARRIRESLDRLRSGYLLTFRPATTPGWHSVRVEVGVKNSSVSGPSGYEVNPHHLGTGVAAPAKR